MQPEQFPWLQTLSTMFVINCGFSNSSLKSRDWTTTNIDLFSCNIWLCSLVWFDISLAVCRGLCNWIFSDYLRSPWICHTRESRRNGNSTLLFRWTQSYFHLPSNSGFPNFEIYWWRVLVIVQRKLLHFTTKTNSWQILIWTCSGVSRIAKSGEPDYYFALFCLKLHKKKYERNSVPSGIRHYSA